MNTSQLLGNVPVSTLISAIQPEMTLVMVTAIVMSLSRPILFREIWLPRTVRKKTPMQVTDTITWGCEYFSILNLH